MPLPPGFVEETPTKGPPSGFSEEGTDWGGIVKQALNEAHMGNGSKIRDLMSDPITQAKALPYLAGAAGMIGLGGGATANMAVAHLLSDAALKSYGREDQIPSVGSQALDVGLAALGDMANAGLAGRAIGKAEKAAGVVTRTPLKLPTSGNVGAALDEMETTLKNALASGTPLGPQSARDIYSTAKYIANNPNIVGKSSDILVQSSRVKAMAQAALNAAVEGRGAPAAIMATAKTVPNMVKPIIQGTRKLPLWAQIGLGATGAGGLLKAMGGVGTSR